MNLYSRAASFHLKLFVIFLLAFSSFNTVAQTVELLKFDSLKNSVHQNNDTLYILNFWATWCKPCIEELPQFERINEEYKVKFVKLILVNLDFHSKVESSVYPFLARKKISSRVVHITDTDPNDWINKVDERWSGAIPATVIYKNGKVVFFKEGNITYEVLKGIIETNINLK